MTEINRKIQPEFKAINKINIAQSETTILDNNIKLHTINSGSQDVVKIDFVFNAGVYCQDKKIQASLTNSMLNEGTSNNNSIQIAELFDFYGAYIEFSVSYREACISIYTLSKHLDKTLPIVIDILKNSNFPEKEFNTIRNKKKQNYIISLEKTSVLAKDKFNQVIYGENHPYANKIDIDDFAKINLDDIKKFFKTYYTTSNCYIVASGKINKNTVEYINKTVSNNWNTKSDFKNKQIKTTPFTEKKHSIAKKDAVQAAIRIGRKLFNKNHDDYVPMQLLNSILGGYFGSRLMQNIREDKGYTYGINSFIFSHNDTGHWAISTEVDVKFCKDTISEIYKEIEKLQTELVDENELKIVKNFIVGDIIRDLDNPFALAESLKSNIVFDKDNSYYSDFIEQTNNINAQTIKEMAIKYLKKEDLYQVISSNE